MEKNKVDLMRICDQCLSDCFQCATSDGRFDDLWNIPANMLLSGGGKDSVPEKERKKHLKDLRDREQKLAKVCICICICVYDAVCCDVLCCVVLCCAVVLVLVLVLVLWLWISSH
jgi:hypothetical protein